jgi:hypothetical protein
VPAPSWTTVLVGSLVDDDEPQPRPASPAKPTTASEVRRAPTPTAERERGGIFTGAA